MVLLCLLPSACLVEHDVTGIILADATGSPDSETGGLAPTSSVASPSAGGTSAGGSAEGGRSAACETLTALHAQGVAGSGSVSHAAHLEREAYYSAYCLAERDTLWTGCFTKANDVWPLRVPETCEEKVMPYVECILLEPFDTCETLTPDVECQPRGTPTASTEESGQCERRISTDAESEEHRHHRVFTGCPSGVSYEIDCLPLEGCMALCTCRADDALVLTFTLPIDEALQDDGWAACRFP